MDENSWFEVEDPAEYGEEPWDFDEEELAFLAALRARTAHWRAPWASSHGGRSEDGTSLLVHVSLLDEDHGLILGQWAAHFSGGEVRAGKVRDQLFHLHESPGHGFFQASGSSEELAERCADWFERLLSRPVVRDVWSGDGGPCAVRWEFADTGEVLGVRGRVPADGSPPARRLAIRS
ncbi:hypothetical protein [Streptomyces sp. t39]|uniref:hypothetical protein n=1 Tax=Streptomyces sp. t39 TaxID=1828156 RepID=UPI0011CD71FE|nr:hypothetical protein [Streptomyces sp. t39]TXS49808.1 hypothetical protein EAO77_29045 [Streptomyces sp. t39]